MMVALDPGLRMCGVAVFKDKVLVSAQVVHNDPAHSALRGAKTWLAMAAEVKFVVQPHCPFGDSGDATLVHELMQVYGLGNRKGDPADLIELAGVAGAVVGVLDPFHAVSYLPREWKGSTPKKVHQVRILSKLDAVEESQIEGDLTRVKDRSAAEDAVVRNAVDAVGIGLFHLGRLKGGIRPRG